MALSQKLALLLALSLLLRVAELISIDLKSMVWSSNEVSFSLRVPRKTPWAPWVGVQVKSKKINNDKRLCPVLCLQRYLQITKHLRNNDTKETLFIYKEAFWENVERRNESLAKISSIFAGIYVSIFGALDTQCCGLNGRSQRSIRGCDHESGRLVIQIVFSDFYHSKIVGLEVSQSLFN